MCVGAPGAETPKPLADKAYVWDLPTRLFHWLLVVCVIAAFVTAKVGGDAMLWHGRLGLAILGLLVFRVVWGFTGPTYARFLQFVRGPHAIRAYLKGEWQGLGHNPLGALSVLALLGVLALQAASGLFANDDIAYSGHLATLVDSECAEDLTDLHHLLENVLMLLVAAHVGAIAFYVRVKRHNLVKPMLTGWADGQPGESTNGSSAAAFIIAVLIAAAVTWTASGALLPPAPPPPAATPAW